MAHVTNESMGWMMNGMLASPMAVGPHRATMADELDRKKNKKSDLKCSKPQQKFIQPRICVSLALM
jgi:hypothetical protein